MSTQQRLQQETGEPFARISVEEAKKLIDSGDVQVIDVRRPDEYVRGHIPGAKLIPVDDFLGRASEVNASKPAVFVCAQGVRSALACEMAAALGQDSSLLYNLEGGTDAWIAASYRVKIGMDA
ncbi:MAG: rhodanese-like domain-containing protein [Chloroflexi bacterium]|nr:rhodanese-like domain-containing protein [Chloroflexota bacterium]